MFQVLDTRRTAPPQLPCFRVPQTAGTAATRRDQPTASTPLPQNHEIQEPAVGCMQWRLPNVLACSTQPSSTYLCQQTCAKPLMVIAEVHRRIYSARHHCLLFRFGKHSTPSSPLQNIKASQPLRGKEYVSLDVPSAASDPTCAQETKDEHVTWIPAMMHTPSRS